MIIDLDAPFVQAHVAAVVGVSQQNISALVLAEKLPNAGKNSEVILAYCARLREQAAGRASENDEGLDLVTERAKLAQAQRFGIEIKNAVARGEYAPIALLGEVLANASQAVSDRFDTLPGLLRKIAPDLPVQVVEALQVTISQARNEWVRATQELKAIEYVGTEDTAELFESTEGGQE